MLLALLVGSALSKLSANLRADYEALRNDVQQANATAERSMIMWFKNQGMPVLGGRGKGDLFVAVTLITPKTLTKDQRKLLEQLAEIEDTEFQDESFMDKVRNIFG